jgi:hypothetical protein
MQPHRPSRRHLLLGALAGLFCWRQVKQTPAATTARPPAPAPRPAASAPAPGLVRTTDWLGREVWVRADLLGLIEQHTLAAKNRPPANPCMWEDLAGTR